MVSSSAFRNKYLNSKLYDIKIELLHLSNQPFILLSPLKGFEKTNLMLRNVHTPIDFPIMVKNKVKVVAPHESVKHKKNVVLHVLHYCRCRD